jgi:hypothetical protein
MEFLLYLTQDSKEILGLLQKAQYAVREDASDCRGKSLFGFAIPSRQLIICTQNIKASGYDLAFYVNETLRHEAVHAAQQCRGGAFWIAKESMPLPWNKLKDATRSTKMTGGNLQVEREAYWMEDKPNEVKYVLSKYCL